MLEEADKVPAALFEAPFEVVMPSGAGAATSTLAKLAPPGKTLVLYFYPKDNTPGCTLEARGFTASTAAIAKAGGVVVGVSRDSTKSHASFRDKCELGIALLSDPERALHEAFGAWGHKTMYGRDVLGAIRSTFLVKDGWVIKAWRGVKVDGHVEQVLAVLRGDRAAPLTSPKLSAKTKPRSKAKPK